MNYDDYKNIDSKPVKPDRPQIKLHANSASHKAYAIVLEQWEKDIEEWKINNKVWQEKQNKLNTQFKKDVLEDIFGKKDCEQFPNAVEALYNRAAEQVGYLGFAEVYNTLNAMSYILEAFKKDLASSGALK